METATNTKDISYNAKLQHYLNKPKYVRKYDQYEIILDFLQSRPDEWFYIWEIMGAKPLGWVSHKAQARINELVHDGKVETRYIGKYAVFSIKK